VAVGPNLWLRPAHVLNLRAAPPANGIHSATSVRLRRPRRNRPALARRRLTTGRQAVDSLVNLELAPISFPRSKRGR
jgi:hypothetical protein